MPDHIVSTSAGPITVTAAEPVPGLHVYEVPEHVNALSPLRWILAHHEGRVLAGFETEDAATGAAEKVGPLSDWTRNAMTSANLLGPDRVDELMNLLRAAGGQQIYA
ncbi:hypothetical protein [Streptomyces sp. NPDC088847]|uniref:hypothetical protein n=1 Tax=Streptomyces sp. NPDC088847 TaxID=3365909 RepID=UPI0038097C3C